MEGWKQALDIFLMEWRGNPIVTGALVCGSYVTGNATKHSDIDVHLLLDEEADWRERGNKVVAGYLIEYFMNPPRQIRAYFQEDYHDRRKMSMVQFVTGQVLWDRTGTLQLLRREAQEWMDKPYEKMPSVRLEQLKYGLWDMQDNFHDCADRGGEELRSVYFNSLHHLFKSYCEFLHLEEIPYHQLLAYLTEPSYLGKYLKEPFPDKEFAALFVKAVKAEEIGDFVLHYDLLTEYVLHKMGGFHIDGWRLRSASK
ncbi:nucleotidyltransferase domain-containing protein [Paenibacillus cymbidii]|uniref:nucleotidyltransferase domain-containing protein n=1 Tax=Paenibacillus cymbidii TaxID=1639034 RepID=UPI00108217A7|nr:nucleotidyltransferase domain-containing protein [Paenibacillus cymbidii]